jgi:hypothetical protein
MRRRPWSMASIHDFRLSSASCFQKMWEASGLSFLQLIDRLLQTALAKRPGLR